MESIEFPNGDVMYFATATWYEGMYVEMVSLNRVGHVHMELKPEVTGLTVDEAYVKVSSWFNSFRCYLGDSAPAWLKESGKVDYILDEEHFDALKARLAKSDGVTKRVEYVAQVSSIS